ncbi:hypothetical protein JCM3775_002153 [Rhodotorula graminis]
MLVVHLALAGLASLAAAEPLLTTRALRDGVPALPLGLHRHLAAQERAAAQLAQGPAWPAGADQLAFSSAETVQDNPAHTFQQLVSHDPAVPPSTPNATFSQRYWFDASHYKPGGPVFLLDGGETDGAGRIPFLRQGILAILSRSTHGLGIILEHRYYGESFPVESLSTDDLRFLDTRQSLHDSAHFARTVKIPGLEHVNLTAGSAAPWYYIGGSYAGAKAAFARKLHPDVFDGAIASSAVTTAIVDFWQYYEPIRASAPADCIERLVESTSLVDTMLALNSPSLTPPLKALFGLDNVTSDADFVNALAIPLGSWQARNWDGAVGSSRFDAFCAALTNKTSTAIAASALSDSLVAAFSPTLGATSFPQDPRKAIASLAAYGEYVKQHVAPLCPPDESQDGCFGTDEYPGDALDDYEWRSWAYQFCTEWGYFIGAAPEGTPSLVSRLLTVEYTSKICRKAFPPGELNRVPAMPNITAVNQLGGANLSHSRLAFVDGSEDPWLYATPHSPTAPNPHRKDTLKRPFKLIKGGVHHWDENGLPPGRTEPPEIAKIHRAEVDFVQTWVSEWREREGGKGKGRWRWKGALAGGAGDGEGEEGAREVGRWL